MHCRGPGEIDKADGFEGRGGVFRTDLPLPARREGKVRDVYGLPGGGEPRLVIVASDRISAFDVVMPTPIPGKGVLLNRLSARWLAWIDGEGLSATHLVEATPDRVHAALLDAGVPAPDAGALRERSMLVRECEIVPVECVVRGYLDGSGWREYRRAGSVCGVPLPPGLERGGKLPEPIFTPSTKAERGEHDENISFEEACERVGREVMTEVRARSLSIYGAAHDHAYRQGVILADTKLEFGWPFGQGARDAPSLVLADEALTPDSSRYWPLARWTPGGVQESFDKQFVREHLQALVDRGEWDKAPPGPELPAEVVGGTMARYREAASLLFGD